MRIRVIRSFEMDNNNVWDPNVASTLSFDDFKWKLRIVMKSLLLLPGRWMKQTRFEKNSFVDEDYVSIPAPKNIDVIAPNATYRIVSKQRSRQ